MTTNEADEVVFREIGAATCPECARFRDMQTLQHIHIERVRDQLWKSNEEIDRLRGMLSAAARDITSAVERRVRFWRSGTAAGWAVVALLLLLIWKVRG